MARGTPAEYGARPLNIIQYRNTKSRIISGRRGPSTQSGELPAKLSLKKLQRALLKRTELLLSDFDAPSFVFVACCLIGRPVQNGGFNKFNRQ